MVKEIGLVEAFSIGGIALVTVYSYVKGLERDEVKPCQSAVTKALASCHCDFLNV